MPSNQDYAAYLAAPLWAEIRERVIGLHESKTCALCKSRRFKVVHHRHYGLLVMNGLATDQELLKALALLCDRCHGLIHFTRNGRKRTVKETERRFVQLLERPRDAKKRKKTRRKKRAKAREASARKKKRQNLPPKELPRLPRRIIGRPRLTPPAPGSFSAGLSPRLVLAGDP